MQVTAAYTYPATDETFNFNVSGLAEAIPIPTPLVINNIDGNFSSVDWKGTARGFLLFGTPGATFDYSLTASGQAAQSGSGTIGEYGFYITPGLTFSQRAAAGVLNFSLTITATSTATSTTTLNPASFGGQTSTHDFTIVQTAQDTVFITRNVTVINEDALGFRLAPGLSSLLYDGLGFEYTANAGTDDQVEVKEMYPMSDTLTEAGVSTTITQTFEVPVNTSIDAVIRYSQQLVSKPGSLLFTMRNYRYG